MIHAFGRKSLTKLPNGRDKTELFPHSINEETKWSLGSSHEESTINVFLFSLEGKSCPFCWQLNLFRYNECTF